MVYKIIKETGDYIDAITGEDVNLLECDIAHTPDGINVGWAEFQSIEEAEQYFNIQKK